MICGRANKENVIKFEENKPKFKAKENYKTITKHR